MSRPPGSVPCTNELRLDQAVLIAIRWERPDEPHRQGGRRVERGSAAPSAAASSRRRAPTAEFGGEVGPWLRHDCSSSRLTTLDVLSRPGARDAEHPYHAAVAAPALERRRVRVPEGESLDLLVGQLRTLLNGRVEARDAGLLTLRRAPAAAPSTPRAHGRGPPAPSSCGPRSGDRTHPSLPGSEGRPWPPRG